MLEIPVKFGVDAKQAEKAIRDFYNGVENALDGIVDLNGTKISFEVDMRTTGDDVVKALNDQDAATKKVIKSTEKYNQGQENSINRAKFRIRELKKERDNLSVNTAKYREAADGVKKLESSLRVLQGVQKGSIADLKAQRAELIGLRDSARINSPEFAQLTAEIKKFDNQLSATRPKANGFVSAFAKIAIVSAGIQSVGAALRGVTNAVDVYVRRAKEVEAFNLAIENIGTSQLETSRIFDEARKTANELGAPLRQIEKSYRRMLPALKAVGATASESDKFIKAVSARSQTLGLNTEQSGRLLEAFAQVLSKGKLQAEELNQQISELDGAFRVQLADALGVTIEELGEMVKAGKITSKVFVEAFNKMENGVEALRLRVKKGNATIQQFQNLIENVDIANIEAVGKAIEPAVKSFLRIRLAFADFIAEFVKTEQFNNLVIVFNSVARGVEIFVKGLLSFISAVNTATTPLFALINAVLSLGDSFGGLVGIVTNIALVFGTAKVAALAFTKALAAKTAVVAFAKSVGLAEIALSRFGIAANVAAGATTLGNTLGQTANGLRITGSAADVAAGSLKTMQKGAVGASTGLAGLGSGGAAAAAGILLTAAALSLFNVEQKKVAEKNKEVNTELDRIGNVLKKTGVEAQTSVNAWEAAIDAFNKFFGLDVSARVEEAQKQTVKFTNVTKGLGLRLKQLKVDITDYKTVQKLSNEDLKEQLELNKALKKQLDERAKQLPTQIALAEASGQPSEVLRLKELAEAIKKSSIETEYNIIQLQKSADEREKQTKKIEEETDSLEKLIEARKRENDILDIAKLKLQKDALDSYGKSVADAADLEAANFGNEIGLAEKRIQFINQRIERSKALAAQENLSAEDRKKILEEQIQLQKELGSAELDLAQKRKAFNEAVIKRFEDVFNQQNRIGQQYRDVGKGIVSEINKIRDSGVNALSTLQQLANQVFARERKGLRPGSREAEELAVKELRFKIEIANIEDQIARAKLESAFQIAQIETQSLQARLRGEAEIARQKGDTQGASALIDAASAQDKILKLREQQYQLDVKSLDIQKRLRDEKLFDEALEKGISREYTNQEVREQKISEQLGIRRTKLSELYRDYKEIRGIIKKGEEDEKAGISLVKKGAEVTEGAVKKAADAAERFKDVMQVARGFTKMMVADLERGIGLLAGSSPARWMGGPVKGGSTYTVNDAGLGREAFMSNSGQIKMLPAGSNIQWTAPTSGTIIPAAVVKRMQLDGKANAAISSVRGQDKPSIGLRASSIGGDNSGNLVKQMTAAMSASGGNQRITNNVTIQSQQPVTDASQIMTNVARMRLRNGRRI